MYKVFLQQQLGLLCFTNGLDGKPQLAGLNVTYKVSKDDPPFQVIKKKFYSK